jgi:hypothetical protein
MPVVAMIYELFCAVVRLLVLRGRRDRSKDVEILVLRKQLEVFGRQVLHLWVPETRFGAVTCWFRDRPIPGSR